MHRLPTKLHVNRAIEATVITDDTQIASGHLIIYYLSSNRKHYLKKFKVPATIFGTLHSDVLPMICVKYC